MGFLNNKKILITGLASKRSIAWGIAKAMSREGATLAFTYQNDKLKSRVEQMATECNSNIILPCDVSSDEEIDNVFIELKKHWNSLDGIVHSIAFAHRTQLAGRYTENSTRDGFCTAHEISSYSFTALAKAGYSMMKGHNSALLCLSYLGAEKAMPNYNVMGLAKASLEANVRYLANDLGQDNIRVNAISAGPIRTLAASGISDFKSMLDHVEKTSPLRRNITIEEVGNVAAFLCSDLSSGITGEITYVDNGYNITGMEPLS
jgi:enoyl-[acyl-carrier protein] reductase I